MVGSMTAKMREGRNVGLPNYISGVDQGRSDVDVFSFGPAYLGSSYTPFTVVGDPNSPKFEIKNLAMNTALASQRDDRERLLHDFDALSPRDGSQRRHGRDGRIRPQGHAIDDQRKGAPPSTYRMSRTLCATATADTRGGSVRCWRGVWLRRAAVG